MSEIIVHGFGGAGINIAKKYRGNTGVKVYLGDTSTANDPDAFVMTAGGIGSGAVRTANIAEVVDGVERYMKEKRLMSTQTDRIHVVIFSASGGSGSTIGPTFIKQLLGREMVIPIIVGDARTKVSATNTVATMKTLIKVGLDLKLGYGIFEYDNINGEAIVDNNIATTISTITTFVSGDVHGIDVSDMMNLTIPTRYPSLGLKDGIYIMNVDSVVDSRYGRDNIMLVRSATTELGKEAEYGNVLHSKNGFYAGEDDHGSSFAVLVLGGVVNNIISWYGDQLKNMEKENEYDVFGEVDDELAL